MNATGIDLRSIIETAAGEDDYRREVLDTARRFKQNWFELGKKLTKVANEELFRDWGYASFEEYCSLEVKIKKNTAIKLTNAWFFLSREEPKYVEETTVPSEIPDLDSVRLLSKAKEDGLEPEMYNQLRENALVKLRSGSTLARQFREMRRRLTDESKTEEVSRPKIAPEVDRVERLLMKSQAPPRLLEAIREIKTFLVGDHHPEPPSTAKSLSA